MPRGSVYYSGVLELLRQRWRYFLVFSLAGLALRLLFVLRFPFIAGDAFIYGEIALTWLKHGVYGVIGATGPTPTLIRVPGYPAFLAMMFRLFGPEHYTAVMYAQVFVDIATCFVVSDVARRIGGKRAVMFAFAIAALCPFTANYVATPLTETLCLFFTALAFDLSIAVLAAIDEGVRPYALALACGLAVSSAIYLRPDSGILLIAIGLVLLAKLWLANSARRASVVMVGVVILLASLVPLAPWTLRNWRTFHVFQPLAPFGATDPGEPVQKGFTRWVHTWIAEYASLEDFAFNVPGEKVAFDSLPARACESAEECERVRRLIDDYNANDAVMTDATDAAFGDLAAKRVAEHPLRHYLVLPVLRIADSWLRPRIEMLPLDVHWWNYNEDAHDTTISLAYGALNLVLLVAAVLGMLKRPRFAAPLVTYILVRTVFLAVIGTVESRYTIECYPALFVFAAYWLAAKTKAQPERLGAEL